MKMVHFELDYSELDKTSGWCGKLTRSSWNDYHRVAARPDVQISDRDCKNPNPEAHPQIELKRILNPI